MKLSPTIGVVGLGYVGLPLAIEFGKKFSVVGFDVSESKIRDLKSRIDRNGEIDSAQFEASKGLTFTADPSSLAGTDYIVVAVPTPVNSAHAPDFSPLLSACQIVGRQMKRGCTVVFESTVYPGATEEVCVPALEQASQMTWKTDFRVGYSPERVNPGDRDRTITDIVKVVSGDSPETLKDLNNLYGAIICAGVHPAGSIKVAEAAKVIENTQRDLNIALVNELSMLFDRMGIDTLEVLEAAGTKWNFLPFRPGLVGGHCIGVDPYYLTHKAEMLGYYPQVILSGRRINDGMGKFIAEKVLRLLISRGNSILGSKVLVMGLTFKEDCSDIRNSKVVDVISELKSYGCEVSVTDPIADVALARQEYGINLVGQFPENEIFDAIVVAVAHQDYKNQPPSRLQSLLAPRGVVADVKGVINNWPGDAGSYWRL